MLQYRGCVELGGLYYCGIPLPRPDRPWLTDLSVLNPVPGLPVGNIPNFTQEPEWSAWRLGDTPADSACRLRWHWLELEDSTLLVCDRVILVRVSWQDLDQAGWVKGHPLELDGRIWSGRLLGGGNLERLECDGYSGAQPRTNEWDGIVANELQIEGLPVPSASDLRKTLDMTSLSSAHNRFWNWVAVNSWTREPHATRPTARCCRGYASANFFYTNTVDHRHEDIGWRPVLEISASHLAFQPHNLSPSAL